MRRGAVFGTGTAHPRTLSPVSGPGAALPPRRGARAGVGRAAPRDARACAARPRCRRPTPRSGRLGSAELAGAGGVDVPGGAGRLGRQPQRQVHPRLDAGGQQVGLGHRHPLGVAAGDLAAELEQAAERRHPGRAGRVDGAALAPLRQLDQPAGQVARVDDARSAGRGPPRGRRRGRRGDAVQPPAEPVERVVGADDQAGPGGEEPGRRAPRRGSARRRPCSGRTRRRRSVQVGSSSSRPDRARRPVRVGVEAADEGVAVRRRPARRRRCGRRRGSGRRCRRRARAPSRRAPRAARRGRRGRRAARGRPPAARRRRRG